MNAESSEDLVAKASDNASSIWPVCGCQFGNNARPEVRILFRTTTGSSSKTVRSTYLEASGDAIKTSLKLYLNVS